MSRTLCRYCLEVLLFYYTFVLTTVLNTGKARVSQNHVMDTSGASALSTMPEWLEIVRLTANFALVDLNKLDGNETKVFFYANVLNLLLAHAAIALHSVWPVDGPARILLLKTACYRVGQLGVVR